MSPALTPARAPHAPAGRPRRGSPPASLAPRSAARPGGRAYERRPTQHSACTATPASIRIAGRRRASGLPLEQRRERQRADHRRHGQQQPQVGEDERPRPSATSSSASVTVVPATSSAASPCSTGRRAATHPGSATEASSTPAPTSHAVIPAPGGRRRDAHRRGPRGGGGSTPRSSSISTTIVFGRERAAHAGQHAPCRGARGVVVRPRAERHLDELAVDGPEERLRQPPAVRQDRRERARQPRQPRGARPRHRAPVAADEHRRGRAQRGRHRTRGDVGRGRGVRQRQPEAEQQQPPGGPGQRCAGRAAAAGRAARTGRHVSRLSPPRFATLPAGHAAPMSLEGKVVAVTGASAGVGRAAARELAARGCDVGLIARGRERLESAAEEIRRAGRRACVAPADVASADQVEAAARQIEDELGPIDIWVNVAMTAVLAEVWEARRRSTCASRRSPTWAASTASRPRCGASGRATAARSCRSAPRCRAAASRCSRRYCGAKHAIKGFLDSLRAELLHEDSSVKVALVQLPGPEHAAVQLGAHAAAQAPAARAADLPAGGRRAGDRLGRRAPEARAVGRLARPSTRSSASGSRPG